MRVGFNVRLKPLPGCSHGPQTWPWWRMFSVSFTKLGVQPPSTGYAMLLYTRAGCRWFDLYFNRVRGTGS